MSHGQENDSVSRAVVPRQDATGLDIPAGRSAGELAPEDYRPAEVTEGNEPAGPARREEPA